MYYKQNKEEETQQRKKKMEWTSCTYFFIFLTAEPNY